MRFRILACAAAWLACAAALPIHPSGPAEPADQADRADQAAELPPPDCVRAMRSARIAAAAGELDRAAAELRAAVDAFPGELAPLVELWRLEMRRGRSPEQAVELRAAIARRLDDPGSDLGPAMLEYLVQGAGENPEELEPIARAIESRLAGNPGDASLVRALARVQDHLGLGDEAYRSWLRAHELDPTEVSLWRLIARETEEERWEPLRERLRPLVDAEDTPTLFRMAYLRSLASLGELDELERRIASYDATNPLESAMVDGYRLRAAWAARDAGDDARAEAYFRAVLESDPRNEVAADAVRLLYPDDAAAAAAPRKSEDALSPQDALAEGAGLLAAGDHEGALPYLRRAAFAMSDSEIAWFNLGLAALKADNLMESEEAFGRAARINPTRPDIYLNRGAALTRLERYDEAVEQLTQALQLDGSLKNAHYYLYRAYLALGEQAKAAEHRARYEN